MSYSLRPTGPMPDLDIATIFIFISLLLYIRRSIRNYQFSVRDTDRAGSSFSGKRLIKRFVIHRVPRVLFRIIKSPRYIRSAAAYRLSLTTRDLVPIVQHWGAFILFVCSM